MAKFEIQAPDGSRYEVEAPDSPAPVAQTAAPAPQGSFAIPDWMKNIAGAVTRGVTSLPTLLASGGSPNMNLSMEEAEQWRKDTNYVDPAQAVRDNTFKPKTSGQKFVANVVEGMSGAAMGPGSMAGKLGVGALSGLGTDVGERVIGGPVGGVIGGLAGGALPAAASVFRGNTAELARRGLEGISDDELRKAQMLMRASKERGIDLTLGQALGRQSNVDSIENMLAGSETGSGVQNIFRNQPNQVRAYAEREVSKLPGTVKAPADAATGLQQGATEAIKNARGYRSNAVSKIMDKSGELDPGEVKAMQEFLRLEANKYPNSRLKDELDNIANKLTLEKKPATESPILDAKGSPMTSSPAQEVPVTKVDQLDRLLREAKDNLTAPNLAKSPVDREAEGKISEQIKQIHDYMGQKFPRYGAARKLHGELSESVVNPMKAGPTGKAAGVQGFQEDKYSPEALAKSTFGQDSPGAKSRILTLERELRTAKQQDKFLDGAKSYLAESIAVATKADGANLRENMAKNISNVFADQKKMANLENTLAGIARASGQKEEPIVSGFKNMLRIVGAAAKRPTRVRGMNEQEIAQEAGDNLVSTFARVFSFVPAEKMARRMERGYQERAMRALDGMLTSPEGVDMLKELARTPVMSEKAKVLTQTLLSTYAANEGETP